MHQRQKVHLTIPLGPLTSTGYQRWNPSAQRLALARALTEAGHLKDAATAYDTLLRQNPASGPANLGMARLHVQRNNPQQAVADYHRAIYGSWQGASSAGRLQARAGLMAWLAEAPADPAPWAALGEAGLASGDFPAAQAKFRQAARLAPSNAGYCDRLRLLNAIVAMDPLPGGAVSTTWLPGREPPNAACKAPRPASPARPTWLWPNGCGTLGNVWAGPPRRGPGRVPGPTGCTPDNRSALTSMYRILVSRTTMLIRSSLAAFLLVGVAAAQTSAFPTPSYFRQTFAGTQTRVELKDPVKLKEMVVDGKLGLSLKSYLELVMANNTDIQLQLLTVETPKNAITRAMSTWDPAASASFSSTRSTSPAVTALAGANTSVSLNQPANFGFAETLPSGMQYNVGYAASKGTTNSSFATLNPSLSSALSVSFTQPLLRNRGAAVNRLNLMMARSRYGIAGSTLKNNLIQLANSAENAYWDVVQARENLRVAQSARKLAVDSLALSQKELDLGAISPLDIYNPQQQLANADLTVSQARFALTQAENALRKQIGADLDPDIRQLPLELTESVESAADSQPLDAERHVERALAARPDLKAAVQSLDTDDMQIRQAKNEILPSLSLTGSYTTQGVGGNVYSGGSGGQTGPPIPGGFGDSLSQMFGFGYPVYSFGLNLSLPIRNHAAVADMADALVQKKRDSLTVRNSRQAIRLSVLNAVSNVESSKESLKLALVARDFAAKYLDAENQKFQLGSEPMQFVLQAQTQLAQAESAVVQAQVGLRRNLLNLFTQTGELLDQRGIAIQ